MDPLSDNAAFDDSYSPSIKDLVQIAHKAGYQRAGRRTIYGWRGHEYISKPTYHGPQVHYPLHAIGEVDCLARWPPRQVGVDLSQIARYIQVGVLPWEDVRPTLHRLVTRWKADLDNTRAQAEKDPDLMKREGEAAARKWGENTFPRVVRQPAGQRAQTFTHILAGALHIQQPADVAAEGQHSLETTFGMRAGRGGALRDLAGLVDNPADIGLIPDNALHAIEHASDDVAELARRATELQVLWHPLATAMIADQLPRPFLCAVRATSKQFNPDFHALFYIQRLAVLAGKKLTAAEHKQQVDNFDIPTAAAEIYRDLPTAAASRAREELRPWARLRLQVALRLADAAQRDRPLD
jgi:hypothetical protein